MGFDRRPFVYATRDFREYIRGVSILQLVRLINGFADFTSESGQPTETASTRVTFGNEGILFRRRARLRTGALRNAAELNNAFRKKSTYASAACVLSNCSCRPMKCGPFTFQCACFICI
jgi:hypothetical protein